MRRYGHWSDSNPAAIAYRRDEGWVPLALCHWVGVLRGDYLAYIQLRVMVYLNYQACVQVEIGTHLIWGSEGCMVVRIEGLSKLFSGIRGYPRVLLPHLHEGSHLGRSSRFISDEM